MASSISTPSVSVGGEVAPAAPASASSMPTDIELSEKNIFVRALLAMLRWLPGSLLWLVTFLTITLPTWMFTIFSTTLTISLNATTVLLIFLVIASTLSWLIRYRFLTNYARLPPEPQRKEPHMDLFPDTQEGERSKPGLANYLDEFLSAIKVFGYLERPVFHELTRTMQTRKLIAGETLLLEEEKGFCIVVDGLVQIFVKSDRNEDSPHTYTDPLGSSANEDDDRRRGRQGYQLLTEVKNGASMSSLFSVLALFTEDIKLRHDEGEHQHRNVPSARGFGGSPVERPASVHGSPLQNADRPPQMYSSMERLSAVPAMSLDTSRGDTSNDESAPTLPNGHASSRPPRAKSVHPNVVARATMDTTIAIIPASAFRRLTRVYPKATAHIVQVILSRLQRVTLATAHSYLGLTDDVLMIEKNMNRYTAYDIPNHLRGNALERLKAKFQRERERVGAKDDGMKGIALHNPNAGRRRQSSSSVRKELLAKIQLTQARSGYTTAANESAIAPDVRSHVSPGDLLANIQVSRASPHHPTLSLGRVESTSPVGGDSDPEVTSPLATRERSPFMPSPRLKIQRQESLDEDDLFRESIVSCMSKAIGISNVKTLNKEESVEQSPRLLSYDRHNQTATFSNAFGFIDPYDGPTEVDSDSIASASAVSASGGFFSQETLSQEIRDDLEIVYFPKGAVLVEQGERNPGLYYVLDGFLDVSYPVAEKSVLPSADQQSATSSFILDPTTPITEDAPAPDRRRNSQASAATGKAKHGRRKTVFLIKPGGLAGYIGTVSSHRSFVDIRAKTDVYVGFLPRASLERFVEKYPVVLLTMAKRLTTLLPRLILHIDFALEWVQVNAGEVIHHQGDESDAIYIVLNGRLRGVVEHGGRDMRVLGEFGQGDSVGELEVMTEARRPATLHAIRDTEVAKFPKMLFNSLALEHPGITMKISKIIAQRMRALVEDPMFEHGGDKRTAAAGGKNPTSSLNLRTIAVLPITAGVPVVDFGTRLLNALTQIGVPNGITSLNHATIMNHLGRHAFSRMGKLKLSQYLADLEERYGMLLYIADTNVNSPWTQTCISQADCILLVALAETSPAIGEYEQFLLGMKTTSRKELVLLHTDRYSPPGLTRKWLRNRLWINGGHHHIQMAFRAPTGPANSQGRRFGAALKQRVQVLQAEIQKYTSRRIRQTPFYNSNTPFKGDFHRLARSLCGRSVGLVLGGGGARGIAQIGIIRALEEADVPVDIVGGTSIGAFNGALYAREGDVVPMYGRAKRFSGRMGSVWRFALDLTYPSASYTTGHEFNRGIFKTFGDSQIEDFWLPFYCNTTNITKSRSEIHNSGYVWRYVRASMSLAGLLPPLCDEGNMLLDGGYVDNLTVSHMKSLGAHIVFAIDVGSADDDTPQAFGDSLSGMWALVNRWNPFSNTANPPTISEIQARLAYVSSVDALERAKHMPGCVYMRPPIDPYGTLDFAKFDEIYDVGYRYGTEFLEKLRGKGILPNMEETEEKKKLRRTLAPRRASI